jgi:hypothetical protein
LVLQGGGWAWGYNPILQKKKIVEKPARNSAGLNRKKIVEEAKA